MSKSKLVGWLLAAWVGGGTLCCRVNQDITAPAGFLPTGPAKVAQEAYGGWMVAALGKSQNPVTVQGELITIHNDTVYILASSQLMAVPTADLGHAKLELHLQKASGYALWTLAGVLSTLSHGAFMLFSLPIWTITGVTVSSSAAHKTNSIRYPETTLEEFRKFSRFPQGLPLGLNPEQLVAKPLVR